MHILDVASPVDGLRLDKEEMHFFRSYRAMFYASGNDDEFSFFDPNVSGPELHEQLAFKHEK
jgi:hypothetical protein